MEQGKTEVKKKVLVVDDESQISEIIKFNLEKEGYEVETAADGQEALNKTHVFKPDIVLLDVMLPIIDGFQVCRKIRESFAMPIIMLTAKEEEVDKVLGFELGADDYITKPFGMRELMARVKANLKRASLSKVDVNTLIYVGDLVIDPSKHELRKHDKDMKLTHLEFELVKYLANNANHVFSREKLLEDVWGYDYAGDPRTVDVTIRRIREKIEDESSKPKYIMTKRSAGYYLNKV